MPERRIITSGDLKFYIVEEPGQRAVSCAFNMKKVFPDVYIHQIDPIWDNQEPQECSVINIAKAYCAPHVSYTMDMFEWEKLAKMKNKDKLWKKLEEYYESEFNL